MLILRENSFGKKQVVTKYYDNDSTILDKKNDFLLQAGDKVVVRKHFSDYDDVNYVSIRGGVQYPGNYPIIKGKNMVLDVINLAGGIVDKANPMASKLIRNGEVLSLGFSKLLKNKRSKINFSVLPGDTIEIGLETDLVRLTGNVRNPGLYQFQKGKNVNDYIKNAGGINRGGSIYEIVVRYPNGKTKNVNPFLFSPVVYDGTEINVGSKIEESHLV